MILELGHFALVLAFVLTTLQVILPSLGTWRGDPALVRSADSLALGQAVMVLLAYLALTMSFVMHDFSVAYVANNSNSELPLHYRISGVWGGHEGSLLLWALVLSGWTVAVMALSRRLPVLFRARVLIVLGFISLGFLAFMLATSNPFDRLIPPAMEGRDLNPLLQDPGLVIHPPLLYMGYVGFAVAFAFAVAALWGGQLHAAWARWTRPWVTAAWTFLTLGIALGSWWAYHELGWGGWWFWDPVENASFMPWLAGTALIHSLAVTEKRNTFKRWTVLLALLAFSLSLLGTFLVRSGVLVSVHAFATDPERGVFILIFLGLVIGSSLSLYAFRARHLESSGHFELMSRETFLLFNNLFLIVATFSILLGTLYPLIIAVLDLPSMSVGAPYFNAIFVPLALPLLFLCAIGPVSRWKRARLREILRRLQVPLAVALILGVAIPLSAYGTAPGITILSVMLGIWCMGGAIAVLWRQFTRMRRGTGAWYSLRHIPRHLLGMASAHLGLGVVALGIAFSATFSQERESVMQPGDTVVLASRVFQFHGVTSVAGPNYDAIRGEISVRRDEAELTRLYPEKRTYRVQRSPMTEAAIYSTFWSDTYAALGEAAPNGSWGVRLYVKPMIQWLWIGAILMTVGGLLAMSDKRYRYRPPRKRVA